MLKKSQRLSQRQFDAVMQKGRVSHSSLFLLRATVGNPDTRISAVAPVKVAKTAVARNASRRKVYAALKGIMPHLVSGLHGIVFSKANLASAKPEKLAGDLKILFTKSKLLHDSV